MALNENGKNELNITIPCCDKGVLNINLTTVDNKPMAAAFKAIMMELGVEITYNEVKKGGGG